MFRKVLEKLGIVSKKPNTNEAIDDALMSSFAVKKEPFIDTKISWLDQPFEDAKESSGVKELREQLKFVEELKKVPTGKPIENFERKVGERFDYEGTTLEVVEDREVTLCAGCIFKDTACRHDITGICSMLIRKDKTSVVFSPVSSTTTETKQAQITKPTTPKNLTKFPHYFAKVPNFTHLDIYMVSEMFKLNSYQHHAVKKLVATGKRGSKDQVKDITEAIATLEAWIEVIKSEESV